MSINYFGEGSSTEVDIDEVLTEVEFQLTSNKVSKLLNPTGNKILVSTESGDMKESIATVGDNRVDMGSNKISHVVDPEDDQDAATKKYVDKQRGDTEQSIVGMKDQLRRYIHTYAMKLIRNGLGGKILVSTATGNVAEAPYNIREIRQPLRNTKGSGYIVTSGPDGEITESSNKLKPVPIVYTSATVGARSGRTKIIQDLIHRLDSTDRIDKLSLASGMYRVTSYCTLDNKNPNLIYVNIYENGQHNNQMKRRIFIAPTFTTSTTKILTQSIITRIPEIQDAKIILTTSMAEGALNGSYSCEFVLEKLD